MAEFGFKPEDYGDEYEIFVWPENATTADLFIAMHTQWRTSAYGMVGLDYAVLPVVMDFSGIPAADRSTIFHSIRVMEMHYLSELRAKKT
jgi:hypothetical protein